MHRKRQEGNLNIRLLARRIPDRGVGGKDLCLVQVMVKDVANGSVTLHRFVRLSLRNKWRDADCRRGCVCACVPRLSRPARDADRFEDGALLFLRIFY